MPGAYSVRVCVLLAIVWSNIVISDQQTLRENVPVDPEVFMGPTELITSKGYPCENHYVTTQDGFILNMQRIPHGRNGKLSSDGPRPAVLLQHGLLGISSNWLDNLANESLGFLLADAGADVWIGNIRGNTYSSNHTRLKPNQDQFWDWSWDEMAAYDLPAMFDHVTRMTGQQQIHYVGHSQGTMIGFAGFSTNVTLAAGHGQALLRSRSRGSGVTPPESHQETSTWDQYDRKLRQFLARDVCQKLGQVMCEDELFVIGGVDKANLIMSRVPVYIAHSPGGTSVKNILHFAQGVNSGLFRKFDYGSAAENQAHYGQPTPSVYLPENCKVPVVAYTGGHDILADPEDVAWLLPLLPNLQATHTLPTWEHLDFIWAYDAPRFLYNDIVQHVLSEA
ncbi:hypothetical protein BaRGS_00006310 [Batillaria attramentaria]|uniref:Lipase n=1 Tax=Batillaria attramentaria TaxID=370345 RepID=A0ABD0LSM0_9CAEN